MVGPPEPAQAPPIQRPGPFVILRVEWSKRGCRLRIRRPGRPSELVGAEGLELRYRVGADAPRHCVGHQSPRRNDGAYLDCHERPQPRERTCVSCAVADAEAAADLHHAHTRDPDQIHRAMLDHLRQPNHLYLAAFRDGSIKVGTSTARRLETRLAEQGAWRAVVTGTTADGFAVRRLEDRVTAELGLAQSVAVSRKLKGLTHPRPDRALETALADLVPAVHRLAGGADGWEAAQRPWSFPDSDHPKWQRPLAYPGAIGEGRHHFRIEGACGRLALVTRPSDHEGPTDEGRADQGPAGPGPSGADGPEGERFVVDLSHLTGREIELGDFTPDALAVQTSLF